MAEMTKGVKVYSDDDEIYDYINENFPPELKSMVFKQMEEKKGLPMDFPFSYTDNDRAYYGLLTKFPDICESGNLLLLICRDKENLYAYLNNAMNNADDDFKEDMAHNLEAVKALFENIDKHKNHDTTIK